MTLSQLIIDLQAHERIVGPDAPVHVERDGAVCCPCCESVFFETIKGVAHEATIMQGRVVIVSEQ